MTPASEPVDGTDVVDRLRRERARLAADPPEPGRPWTRTWTAAVDAALVELARRVPTSNRFCLVAVGGYGRGELCPGSDLDVLVLHERMEDDALETAIRTIIYPLWDANLKVGYAVRNRREAVAAIDDLDSATALLDARPLAGDAALLREVSAHAIRRLQRRPAKFLDGLTQADTERRLTAGDAAEALEPNLKNGAGGLRDVQSLRWAAGVLLGEVGLDPLVSAGYIGAEDRTRLSRAYDQLLAERVATHLVADRALDSLQFGVQDEVAERLGHVDGAEDLDTAAHRLLSEHFLAARTVDHVHERAWRLISADATSGRRRRRPAQALLDGFEIVDGILRVPDGVDINEDALPVRLLRALGRTGAVLDRRTAAQLRRHSATSTDVVWTHAMREGFLNELWYGDRALVPVYELDDAGVIASMIPEWAPVRGRAQRNPFHKYSLDRHLWHAATGLGDLVRHEHWAASTLERVPDRDALMLGTLLHDIGKAHGEPHSMTGIPVAEAICRRLGASEATTARVGTMVKLHLLLPDIATKRDLSDAAVVGAVAEQVQDPEMLASLHLLSAADALATGPSAWTAWKAALIQTLVTKVAAVLDETHPDTLGDGAAATANAAEDLAEELGSTPQQVRDHLAKLPQRYAASVTPRAIVRHALLASSDMDPTEVRTRVTPGPQAESAHDAYDELDVVALDAPGLFSKVAGVLALNGGSILGATAHTRADGIAVDTFTVIKPEAATSTWWARVEGDLVDAVAGRLALRARVARRARQEDRKISRLPEVATTVTVGTDEAGRSTILEVKAQDRVGVLFSITDALAELEVDIVVARIQTMGHELVDAFTLRDGDGEPLDSDHQTEVELAVTSALEALAGRLG